MEIDIINYTSSQYAALSDEQILEVKRVQLAKNRLQSKLEAKKKSEKFRLIENGTYTKELWDYLCEELEETYLQEVEGLRNGLLFVLQYGYREENGGSGGSTYWLDYSLKGEERAALVRDYYMNGFTNAVARYSAFLSDYAARRYLGEYYAGLHDHLKRLSDEAEKAQ